MPVGIRLGAVSLDQGGHKASHPAGLERQHPSFIHIPGGKTHEVNVLDDLVLEPGAFYLMDWGYLDFARLYVIHEAQAFFVTRAKSNTKFKRRYSHPVNRAGTAVLYDQTGVLMTH